MKLILHFLDEADFQNFTAQLFSEELPSFQAIEGAGGDGGLDGIDGESAYQMYFPEEKNRNKKKYIEKIDDSLGKLKETVEEHDLTITRWVLVIPEDVYYEVVLYLKKVSKEYGIECIYWGATKLTALVNKHPYIKSAFPGIFLTDLKVDLERVSDGIAELSRKTTSSTADTLKEDDYHAEVDRINNQMQSEMHSINIRFGNSSVPQVASMAIHKKYQPMLDELRRRKEVSDKIYELELREINIQFEDLLEKKNSEHTGRGTYHSGIRLQDIEKIEEKRNIELEKLSIKYGKPHGQSATASNITDSEQSPELQLQPLQLLAMKVFADMKQAKAITVLRTMQGEILNPNGQVSGTLLEAFSEVDSQEMIANLDELVNRDILKP
ncbi:hypothetical protein I8H89_03800, partial [Candidatus Saccharibacteria bacterium]|nr:hypothetical protein [Candidatus Saccharibacteria bacterium]